MHRTFFPSSCTSTGTSANSIGASRDARGGGRRCWSIGAVPWPSTPAPTEAPPRSMSPNLNRQPHSEVPAYRQRAPVRRWSRSTILVALQRSSLCTPRVAATGLQGWPWAPPDQWLVNLPLRSLHFSCSNAHPPASPWITMKPAALVLPVSSSCPRGSKGEKKPAKSYSALLRGKDILAGNQRQSSSYGHLLVGRDLPVCLCARTWRRPVCKYIPPGEVALRRFAILHCPVASARRQPGLQASPPSSQVSRKPWNPHTHL